MLLLAQHSARVQLSAYMRYLSSVPSRLYSSSDIIQAGDRVLLQLKGKDPVLSKVLRPQGWHNFQHGHVKHADLIGKRARDTVTTSRGEELRLYLPTLADYVTMTPRLVTPVYPADANLIVSLLDLHVSPSGFCSGPPSLEILEAGTGHGALTLYLARAIHAASPPRLEEDPASKSKMAEDVDQESDGAHIKDPAIDREDSSLSDISYEHGQDQRQAVIHTIDVSLKNSTHAKGTIEGFRRGIYAKDIEFHVGDVSKWIDKQAIDRGVDSKDETFLSHIILDMPAAQRHIEKAASVLHVNGSLLAFNPSITQIMAIVELIRQQYLPLQLDRVIELGPNMTGGREWDIRSVVPRAQNQAVGKGGPSAIVEDAEEEVTENSLEDVAISEVANVETRDEEAAQVLARQEASWKMVCRPKVGYRVSGGGFLGVWRKMKWSRSSG